MLLDLAFRNVFRHRGRTGMVLAAIVAGVAALILSGGFVRDLYHQLGESIIRSQTGHLQIANPALFAEGSRAPEKYRVADPARIKAAIESVPGVERAMARLYFSGLLGNGRVDVPIVGEGGEPDKEAALSTSLKIIEGRPLASKDVNGALVGEGLARTLGLKPGDGVTVLASTLEGAMNTVDLTVVGVFRSFSKEYDERALKVSLVSAQELLATRDANTIVVQLTMTEGTRRIAGAIAERLRSEDLTVRTWDELNDFYANTVLLYDRQFAVLRLIILILVVLGVASTVNMTVHERMAEFGTMRALGNRAGWVTGLILTECLVLGLAGALIGVTLGVVAALVLSSIGIPMPPPPNSSVGYTARIALAPIVLLDAAIVGTAAPVISGVLPALRARRIAIVDALRQAI
jgi:putative ABC transport system permease protein